jgi:hypothetical protein
MKDVPWASPYRALKPKILEDLRGDLVHMSNSASFTFRILYFFKISHFYVFKNYGVKYIDRYVQEECVRKSPVKKYIVF